MNLEFGDWENLTGNGIVYWQVIGKNYIAPDSEIIAANFTISTLPLENKLLTATFPPIPFQDKDDLLEKIINVKCDIIYGGELHFPEDENNFNDFYKKEFAKYNKIVEEYSDKFKERFEFNVEKMTEAEKLTQLQNLTVKIRDQLSRGHFNFNSNKYLRWKKLTENISAHYTKYNVENLSKVIHLPGKQADDLSTLYTQKNLAIFYEKYEEASRLNSRIQVLEDILFSK